MHKLLATTLILVGLVSTLNADASKVMKLQCEYLVNDDGDNDSNSNTFMVGAVAGVMYSTVKEKQTEFSRKADYGQVTKKACKVALKDRRPLSFKDKFFWGIRTIVDQDFTMTKVVP